MNALIFPYLLALTLFVFFLGRFNNHFLRIKLLEKDRDISIDGLRGYLALNVMVHHYYIFYVWTKTGQWKMPDLTYIKNLGHASVFIFFMITGYLFISKLRKCLSSNTLPVWRAIYISRFFRIVPLYVVVVFLTILISIYEQGFEIKTGALEIINEIIEWGLFIGSSVNGSEDAKLIHAGVTWTLKYEWLFYFSLPLIFIVLRSRFFTILLSVIVIAVFIRTFNFPLFSTKYIILFAAGGWVGWLKDKIKSIDFNSALVSIAGLSFIALTIIFDDSKREIPLTLSSVFIFLIVACGNDFFGLLRRESSRLMGEVSYSIYLIHGIVIYVIFRLFLFKFFDIPEWIYISLFIPVSAIVLFISMVTFKKIEHPAYMFGKRMSLRRKLD